MKKIIKIGVILAVLFSMAGFASANTISVTNDMEVDIPSNAVSQYPVKAEPGFLGVTTLDFAIYEENSTNPGVWDVPTTEVVGNINGGSWESASSSGVTTTALDGIYATWTFYIKDNGDGDDDTQINKKYLVHFTSTADPTGVKSILVGQGESVITGVPEFPTIALPIAAILGLAFIFQRRREEE